MPPSLSTAGEGNRLLLGDPLFLKLHLLLQSALQQSKRQYGSLPFVLHQKKRKKDHPCEHNKRPWKGLTLWLKFSTRKRFLGSGNRKTSVDLFVAFYFYIKMGVPG